MVGEKLIDHTPRECLLAFGGRELIDIFDPSDFSALRPANSCCKDSFFQVPGIANPSQFVKDMFLNKP